MKRELRERLRQTLAAISAETLRERSAAACQRLCEQPEFRRAETIMIFLSMAQEVDTSRIALAAWSEGKRVLAPRVAWEQRRMQPVQIRSLTSDVRESTLGLREPVAGMPVQIGEIDLVLVPGLAFDPHGNRLGRGRGFYDRFLSHRDFRAVRCGLAFEAQMVEAVPVKPHDVCVHLLVTEQRVLRFPSRPAARPAGAPA